MAVETERTGRPLLIAAANAMRDRGHTLMAIGDALGVHHTTIHRWTSPYAVAREQRRAREKYHGGPVLARECGADDCRNVIGPEEYAGKRYCSLPCKARAQRLRTDIRMAGNIGAAGPETPE